MTVYPPRSALCIAHCAIVPEMRGRGLFRQALEAVLAMHQGHASVDGGGIARARSRSRSPALTP